ncbi:hypothetical protein JCM11641_003153 [Rhodosporidiobolus odoratus]
MPSDSEGSNYEPDSPNTVPRPFNARNARDLSSQLDFSTDPAESLLQTAVGTPIGSEPAEDTTAEATPAPEQPAAPAKKSKALNFLKKKEPKTSINIKGTTYQIRDDEIVLQDDPRGEAKVDSEGNLLGGRKWKVHTFTSPLRVNSNKVYILSIDAARCAGFRDSLYFFRRNPLIHKLSCNQQEKDRLIELGRLSGNLKSRAVTMVSARNVFKVMGATFVQDGKYVIDDYYEDKSIASGHKAGEPAFVEPYDPERDTGTLATSKGNAPKGATSLGLNVLIGHSSKPKPPGVDLITSQIGGGIHATFGGIGLQPFGKAADPAARKQKPAAHLTPENWMLEYAQAVRETNEDYISVRRANVGQVEVGLNVEEKEEDCWEWVEEEYTDDEEEQKPLLMQLDPPLAASSPYPPIPTGPLPPLNSGPGYPSPSLHGFSVPAAPAPHAPVAPTPIPGHSPAPPPFDPARPPPFGISNPHLPQLPPTNSTFAPVPSRPASPTPAAPKPKKKRMIRVYNPIRGVYDPETNVPHVYQATQPTTAEMVRIDRRARVFDEEDGEDAAALLPSHVNGLSNGHAGDRSAKRRKMEEAAARIGTASVEYVSDERAWALEDEEQLVVAMMAARGREPRVPGQWDFTSGEGLVA